MATTRSCCWTAIPHGYLYMLLLITAVDLGLRAKWSWKRLILIALAGTVPFLSFVAERSATKDIRREARRQGRNGGDSAPRLLLNVALSILLGCGLSLSSYSTGSGRICSFPIKATMRSKSSIVANSMMILPFVLPKSTLTRVSKWSESRSARSFGLRRNDLGLMPVPCESFPMITESDQLLDGTDR